MGPDYIPDYDLLGNAAFAPASHFGSRLTALTKADEVVPAMPFILYILDSYATTNPEIDLEAILSDEAIAHLAELHEVCEAEVMDLDYWSQAIASEQFVAEPDLEAFLAMAQANEPGQLEIDVPTHVFQGTADHTVTPAGTDATVRQMCENGNSLRYTALQGTSHRGAITDGADQAFDWIEARFAGHDATDNCDDLPTAGSG